MHHCRACSNFHRMTTRYSRGRRAVSQRSNYGLQPTGAGRPQVVPRHQVVEHQVRELEHPTTPQVNSGVGWLQGLSTDQRTIGDKVGHARTTRDLGHPE